MPESVRVRSSHFDEDMAAAKRNGCEILLSPTYGFTDADFSRLRPHTWIGSLDIYDSKITSCEGLDALRQLRQLTLRGEVPNKFVAGIDCAWFPKLTSICIPCVPRFRWPSESSPLKFVSISRYRPKSNDLTELPAWRHVTIISIFGGGGLRSLKGVGRFQRLEVLTLDWIRNIDTLRHMGDATRLKRVRLGCCPRLTSLDGIEDCISLEEIAIGKCKALKSVLPASRLLHLKSLRVLLSPVNKSEAEHFKHVPDCIIMPRIGMREVRAEFGDEWLRTFLTQADEAK